jgi:hypothetical protein
MSAPETARLARNVLRRCGGAACLLLATALGCSSGQLGGDSWVWKRPCATAEQLEADRQACMGQTVGVVDPSGRGSEYGPDLFRECMESRGWQRVAPGTVLECK